MKQCNSAALALCQTIGRRGRRVILQTAVEPYLRGFREFRRIIQIFIDSVLWVYWQSESVTRN